MTRTRTAGILGAMATAAFGGYRNEDAGDSGAKPNGPNSASGRIKVAEKDIDAETRTFSITFTDGTAHEVTLDSLPSDIVTQLALHGLSQKLGDSYASVKGNVADAKAKYTAAFEQLMAGEWKKAREAGEGGAKVTELAAAIAQIRGVSVEKANAAVAGAPPEKVKAWKANAKIKAAIAEIRAKKAAERAAKAEAAAAGGEAAGDDAIEAIDFDAA